MNSYEKKIEELVERAMDKAEMPLYDLIMSENLQEMELGTLTILSGNELSNATVPCEEFMILVRDRYDAVANDTVAEYAIYSQHDADGHNLINSLNANAVYRLELVGEELFVSMAAAIAHAYTLINTITQSEREEEEAFVRNITDDDPLAELTVQDAKRILDEARKDYDVPKHLSPVRFIALYNSMKPEEEV